MAVFGFQLLLTIIVLSVLNKISLKYSFARWILTKGGLIRYLHPTNEQLKESIAQQSKCDEISAASKNVNNSSTAANLNDRQRKRNQRKNHRQQNNNNNSGKQETFYVPKNLTLALDSEPLHIFHLVQLPYYNELQWLIDFSLCTVLIYFITEIYYSFLNEKAIHNEYNLSIIWCLLALGFVIKILCSITATYFRGEESIGERSICIVSFCIYLLIAMIILIADEETLEFGLVDAYGNFSKKAYRLLEIQGAIEHAYGPSSFLMIKFWLAIICAIIGALFAFPGLRIAQMHFDALIYAKGNQFLTLLYHMSFISPLFIVLAWMKPVARNYFVKRQSMTNESFESARLILILVILALRFCLFRKYLQSYLNIAPQKINYLRKQTGKITNIDVQKLIARVGHYLSVASLQYLAPLLLCLFLTFLTKSTGGYYWTGSISLFHQSVNHSSSFNNIGNGSSFNTTIISDNNNNISENLIPTNFSTLINQSENFQSSSSSDSIQVNNDNTTNNSNNTEAEDVAKLALTMLRDVFNPIILRSFLGFILWWTCTCWFTTSVVGFIYNSYFRQN